MRRTIIWMLALTALLLPPRLNGESFARRGDFTADAIARTKVALAALRTDRVVSAVRLSGGTLKLQVWDLTAAGQLTPKGTAAAGAISEVAMIGLGSTRVVTAVREGDGKLMLIVWDIAGNGTLMRRGSFHGVASSQIRVQKAGVLAGEAHGQIATALRDANGKLRLDLWNVTQSGQIEHKGQAVDVPATSLDIVGPDLLSAVRGGNGKLRVTRWWPNPGGDLFRGGSGTGGPAHRIAVTSASSGRFITAATDSASVGVFYGPTRVNRVLLDCGAHLVLTSWEPVDGSLQSNLKQVAQASTGYACEVATAWASGPSRLVTAIGALTDLDEPTPPQVRLKLIAWSEGLNQHDVIAIERVTDISAGPFSNFDLVAPAARRLVSAGRESHGKLKLIVWDYNL